jgi:deferrochelatase/peroxidase EfeB
MSAITEAADIQAIVERGFGSLGGSSYLLLRVETPELARAWLRSLPVTSLADALATRLERVCQIAFTAPGLTALGLDPESEQGFAPEFLDGMASDERRSHRLGDDGENAPSHWRWGIGEDEPHVLVMLLASAGAIGELESEILTVLAGAGCRLISANRGNTSVRREPFGFTDGLSQPDLDWHGTLKTGGAKDRIYRHSLAMGEALLGYPNEYGFVTDYPKERELGRNGSYLVYRQLAQDVRGFWRWLRESAEEGQAVRLAEIMVGRGIDGSALPGLGAPGNDPNAFTFADDPDGIRCPIGAHIRRANPRSGDDPQGHRGFLRDVVSSLGLKGSAMHDAVASARFHRIVRRGRSYGPTVTPEQAMEGDVPAEESGLHFICLNANLSRQFEFVQGAWLSSPYFGGLSGEQDPMMGNRQPVNGGGETDGFAYVDDAGCPRLVSGLPQFVTVKGGAYFFLPGLRGLQLILAD